MSKLTTHTGTVTINSQNVGGIKNISFDPGTRSLIDVTPLDAIFKKYRPGNISGATGSVTVFFDSADVGQAAALTLFSNVSTLVATTAITINALATGANYALTGLITNITGGTSVNGALEATISFKAVGATTCT